MKSTLFFHMGPGLNAYVERTLLEKKQPEVEFWDQPLVTGEKAFAQLTEAAVAKVDEMNQEHGPIRFIAHSFGGHLASAVLRARPNAVSECFFFNTGFSVAGGFYRLLHCLKEDGSTPSDLKEKITSFLKQNPQAQDEKLWDYCQLVAADPMFMRLYWPNAQLFQKYISVAQSAPPMSFPSFQAVLSDFYATSPFTQPINWNGKLEVTLGGRDPLIDINFEGNHWKKLFPQASVNIKQDSGHFSHLEPHLN